MPHDPLKGILEELAAPMQAAQRDIRDFAAPFIEEMAHLVAPVMPAPRQRVATPVPQQQPRPAVLPRRLIVDDEGVGLGQIEDLRGEEQYVDEVEAYMRRKDRAAVDHKDEFYQRVALKDEAQKELEAEAPFSRSNPKSAVDAIFGNQELVQAGATATKELCRWTGENIDATNVTVALGLIGQPPPGNQPNIIRPYGIVKVGTDGNLSTFEVDIGMGCQFTVAGSFVSVSAGLDDDGGANAGSAVLTANLSFRNVTHSVPMTRTKYTPASGSPVTVQVPAFAKSVLLFNNDATQTYTLTFKDWAGNTAYVSSILANAVVQTVPIPLAGDIEQIVITPGGGTPACRVVFQLAV